MSRASGEKLSTNSSKREGSLALIFDAIHDGLIVSCQATAGTPMDTPAFITAQALTVESAGAKAIRAEGLENVRSISKHVKIPVIGLIKSFTTDSQVYITPTVDDVLGLVDAGADIVAVDATQRSRLGGVSLKNFYLEVRERTSIPMLADIDSFENALYAQELGFDLIATTLNGYTDEPTIGLPNLDLVAEIAKEVRIPIIAEGGFATPGQVQQAIKNGAWAVCVGTAITNPYLTTQYFIKEAF
jgi:N-acylglucosamine-6-phosphate 2-epimerase